jgi:hypothetical protein
MFSDRISWWKSSSRFIINRLRACNALSRAISCGTGKEIGIIPGNTERFLKKEIAKGILRWRLIHRYWNLLDNRFGHLVTVSRNWLAANSVNLPVRMSSMFWFQDCQKIIWIIFTRIHNAIMCSYRITKHFADYSRWRTDENSDICQNSSAIPTRRFHSLWLPFNLAVGQNPMKSSQMQCASLWLIFRFMNQRTWLCNS